MNLPKKLNLNEIKDQLIIENDSDYNYVYIGAKDSSFKKRVEIIHRSPNLKSRISVRAIIFDNAKFDLEAILKIDKGARLTDTYLKIDCLVVGESSYARAVPSLEIKESEVKGGHGATIGYIDQNQLNYLYSKGISKKNAERLLIKAFTKI